MIIEEGKGEKRMNSETTEKIVEQEVSYKYRHRMLLSSYIKQEEKDIPLNQDYANEEIHKLQK